ncbi:MAG: methylated-DNA--[protein]-cysteine S-methyltransferase [Tannerella sp.]|nr:methylated-DNA--[protein]-cysteine S-methyltransferase [Tannerella sp.]
MSTCSVYYDSPVGRLRLFASGRGITAIRFADSRPVRQEAGEEETPLLREAVRQLAEYFEGKRRRFELSLDLPGTDFQKRVWQALLAVPYGETRSYGQIAVAAGSPKGARATGMACNRNAVSIIVPCHRIVGAGGQLVGYAGGMERKRWLLAMERKCKDASVNL